MFQIPLVTNPPGGKFRLLGPEPQQADSRTDVRLWDCLITEIPPPSPRKPDSPQRPINSIDTCRGVSHIVRPVEPFAFRFVAEQRAGEIKFWSWDCIFHPSPCPIPISTSPQKKPPRAPING